MRRQFKPSAKEVFAWETDPESASEDEESDESVNEEKSPEDVSTEQPEPEDAEASKAEAQDDDKNPMVLKSFVDYMEDIVNNSVEYK